MPSRPGTHRRPCPACNKGKRDDALAVTVHGDGGAVWFCHRCGLRGCTRGQSISGRGRPQQPIARHDDTQERVERALRLWREAGPISGSPAERYLRGRGLDPARLLTDPPGWPETLRWHPDADGRGTGALVVAINHRDHGHVRAVHRIYLHSDGSPLRDDAGRKIKRALAPIGGHAATLSCWPHQTGWWGLAEGVETALAARQVTLIPTWAAINANNLPAVRPPAWARHAVVFADHDESGTGLREAGRALHAFRALAHVETARVMMADALGADVADVLARGGHG